MTQKLEGIEVKIGSKTFIVPPMSLAIAKRTRADRVLINDESLSVEQKLEAAARVMHASMVSNYPELTLEELEDLITMNNFSRILAGVAKAWHFDPDAEPATA